MYYYAGECSELLERIYKYEGGASSVIQYPISEAMIAVATTASSCTKDSKAADSQEQEFLPFLTVSTVISISHRHIIIMIVIICLWY